MCAVLCCEVGLRKVGSHLPPVVVVVPGVWHSFNWLLPSSRCRRLRCDGMAVRSLTISVSDSNQPALLTRQNRPVVTQTMNVFVITAELHTSTFYRAHQSYKYGKVGGWLENNSPLETHISVPLMHFLPDRTEVKSVFTASPSCVRVLNISTGKELKLKINDNNFKIVIEMCGDHWGFHQRWCLHFYRYCFSNKRVPQR